MSTDTPGGTGDHEHYFYYLNPNVDRLTVYDYNGREYKHCEKKAIHVRLWDSITSVDLMIELVLKLNEYITKRIMRPKKEKEKLENHGGH